MQLPVYIIATQYKAGTAKATGKPYEIHTADVLVDVIDPEGNINKQVATMRLPRECPRGLNGNYIAIVDCYVNQQKDLAFAVRKLEPAKPQQKAA